MSDDDFFSVLDFIWSICFFAVFFAFFIGFIFFGFLCGILPNSVGIEEVNFLVHDLYGCDEWSGRCRLHIDRCYFLSVTIVTTLFLFGSFIRHLREPAEDDGTLFKCYGVLFVILGILLIWCGGISFGIVSMTGGFLLSWRIYRYGLSKSPSPKLDDADILKIYTPVRTSKQWDTVTPIYGIEEVGEYAECPYCGSNIRKTFYELGGIVRCNKCGAFHHKECFEYYGRKCGSSSCKLREA